MARENTGGGSVGGNIRTGSPSNGSTSRGVVGSKRYNSNYDTGLGWSDPRIARQKLKAEQLAAEQAGPVLSPPVPGARPLAPGGPVLGPQGLSRPGFNGFNIDGDMWNAIPSTNALAGGGRGPKRGGGVQK